MMKNFRNLFFTFLLFLLLFAGVKKAYSMSAFQQNETARQFEERFNQAVRSPDMNLESFFGMAITNTFMWTNKAVGGETKVVQGPNGPVYTREGGAIDVIANLTGTLYTVQPASSVEYLAYVGNNLGIVKPAYAQQGLGFQAFSPVLTLWKTFRDIAYLGFVIIFVVVGLMIMFRRKIDPRTVVTVQEALPRIVVALILVTFSYAIAGVIVDIGELLIRIIANLLYNGQFLGVSAPDLEASRRELLASDIFKLVNPIRNVDQIVKGIGEISAAPTQISIGPINLSEITVKVAFWLMGFFIMFKIFFALLSPYVSILLSVIFAPFQLLSTAIPDQNDAFMGWLRGLLVNVLVFPVTFAMLAIAAILKAGTEMAKCPPPPSGFMGPSAPWCTSDQPITSLWSPVTIGNWGGVIGELVGWGILFTIPKVVEMLQEALKHKPSPIAGVGGAEMLKGIAGMPVVGSFFRRAVQ